MYMILGICIVSYVPIMVLDIDLFKFYKCGLCINKNKYRIICSQSLSILIHVYNVQKFSLCEYNCLTHKNMVNYSHY